MWPADRGPPQPPPGSRQPAVSAAVTALRRSAETLFSKQQTLPASCFMLPLQPQMLFEALEAPIEPSMARAKDAANAVKSRLDVMDQKIWGELSRATNLTGDLVRALRAPDVQAEMATIAWLKQYEILSRYRLLQNVGADLESVHVCEAVRAWREKCLSRCILLTQPGAFIAATNHYLRQLHGDSLKWDWTGLSLNPYFEDNDPAHMLHDDMFILYTERHWCFGPDDSGDIMQAENIRAICRRHPRGAQLVTGDGGIDVSDQPKEQEMLTAHLHFCEAVAALACLAPGGAMILKMYTLFERPTAALLFLMGHFFERLDICKPGTSKAANGETYAVGIGFKGIPAGLLDALLSFVTPQPPCDAQGRRLALLDERLFPPQFNESMAQIANFFADYTSSQIELTLDLNQTLLRERSVRNEGDTVNPSSTAATPKNLKSLQQQVNRDFFRLFPVRSIPASQRIVTQEYLDGAKNLSSAQRIDSKFTMHVDGALAATLEERQESKARTQKRRALLLGKSDINGHAQADEPQAKRAKAESTASAQPTFAERMMAQMGHKTGEALGQGRGGLTAPLEVAVREERAGLGAPQASQSASDPPPGWPLFEDLDNVTAPLALQNAAPPTAEEVAAYPLVGGRPLGMIGLTRFARLSVLSRLQDSRLEPLLEVLPRLGERPLTDTVPHLALNNPEEGVVVELLKSKLQPHPRLALLAQVICRATSDFLSAAPSTCLALGGEAAAAMAAGVRLLYNSDLSTTTTTSATVDLGIVAMPVAPEACAGPGKGVPEADGQLQALLDLQTALASLRPGGSLIFIVGDAYTRFTASLLYILHRAFRASRLIKPFLCSSLCGERLFVAAQRHDNIEPLLQHLGSAITAFKQLSQEGRALLSFVPVSCLLEPKFLSHLLRANEMGAEREVQSTLYYTALLNGSAAPPTNTLAEAKAWLGKILGVALEHG